MNGGRPVILAKQTEEGYARRLRLLQDAGFCDVETYVEDELPDGVAADDVVDAYAACWSAGRIALGIAVCVPDGEPPVDGRGLQMKIWW